LSSVATATTAAIAGSANVSAATVRAVNVC
jgi:hypothetical protein